MMDKQKMKQFREKKRRTHALHTRIMITIFIIIVSFIFFIGLGMCFAVKMGFSLKYFKNPFTVIWILGCLCAVLASVATIFLMRKIFEPLRDLSEASLQVAEGNFDIEIPYRGHLEELVNTIDNFNRMVKELNSVEVMRNDFVADVSHEFKTPLAAISGYTTFLQDPELGEEERNEYIEKICFNVDKLNELTENILRLSKLEHQQFLIEDETYRLDEQIREAIVLLEPKWGLKNTEFDLDMPEISYTGQKSLLFQVWMNIIGNAIKYTDKNGKIQIYLKEHQNRYQIIVSDNGIGMSKETQMHIFDKFYQGDTTRKAQGNGLGLALCKEIINKCNGKIIVESEEGIGTVIIVQLPKKEELDG